MLIRRLPRCLRQRTDRFPQGRGIRNRVDAQRSGYALPRDLPDWRSGTTPFASWTKKPLLLFRRSALLLFRLKHLQHQRPAKPPLLPLSRLPQQRPPRHVVQYLHSMPRTRLPVPPMPDRRARWRKRLGKYGRKGGWMIVDAGMDGEDAG